MLSTLAILAAAAILPLAGVCGLRLLYMVFLRQAVVSLCGHRLSERVIERIAHDLAWQNGLMLSSGGLASALLIVVGLPAAIAAGPVMVAVLLAFLMTHRTVECYTTIDPAHAALVALLTVAGGNLPLIVAVPVVLLLSSMN